MNKLRGSCIKDFKIESFSLLKKLSNFKEKKYHSLKIQR